MRELPSNFELGGIFYEKLGNQEILTHIARDHSRIQLIKDKHQSTYTGTWTPGETAGQSLLRIYKLGFLLGKEYSLYAEIADGPEIKTTNQAQILKALEKIYDLPDASIRFVRLDNSGQRTITISRPSNDQQIDIGISAEFRGITMLKEALILTAAPLPVMLAFNRMMAHLFPEDSYRMRLGH